MATFPSAQKPNNLFSFGGQQAPPPKSPKSPKMTLENPLLKNGPGLFMSGNSTISSFAAPSLVPEQQKGMRSPLMPMAMNLNNNKESGANKQTQKSTMAFTPGPPPKASLSLMGTIPSSHPSTPGPTAAPKADSQRMHPQPVKTPPPVASPTFLSPDTRFKSSSTATTSSTMTTTGLMSAARMTSPSDHWVIAYGYQNTNDYNEFRQRLSHHGIILQQQDSNGRNWFAVQYETQVSAEKALCGQPIRLSSNCLCGTVRGSPELLTSLVGGAGTSSAKEGGSLPYIENVQSKHQRSSSTKMECSNSRPIEEKDILAFDGTDEKANRRNRPNNVCDKVFAWIFGWSLTDDDNAEDRPHSD